MRAVGVRAFGGANAVEVMDTARPEPGQGDAVVKVAFAGVNFIDVYMRNGKVEKVGAGVTNVKPGDRVAWCLSRGSYAEAASVPAWRLAPVPDGVPLDVAAALQLHGCTAHYLTAHCFPVQKGDVCLVHAAAGGTGQLLTQLCKLKGGSVIATVGTQDKAAIARNRGADHIIYYREEDFQRRVLEITNGAGAHVAFDSIGKDTIAKSLRSLRRRGVCVSYGNASGMVASITPAELGEAGSVYFTRPHLADYMQTADEVRQRTGELYALYKAGRLGVAIDRVFPLDGAKQAHEVLEGRGTRGKLLLKVA
jgi:NADPH2:quinone reductase